MKQPHQPTREDLKSLVESGLEAATHIPLREALTPHLIEPHVRMLVWPYSKPEVEFPCWIIADLGFPPGLTLAYSVHGHGSHGDPWGVVFASDTAFGRDDSWFTCLEDAFINSGAWKQPLLSEYEIQ
jgi:hypothetical protein